MPLPQGVAALYIGRLLTGAGVGCGLNIVPVYVAEIAPSTCVAPRLWAPRLPDARAALSARRARRMRGGLIGVNQLAINCGITLAFALGLPAVGLSWRIGRSVSFRVVSSSAPFWPGRWFRRRICI